MHLIVFLRFYFYDLPSAVCRLPSAVCRLPSAVCRHYNKTRFLQHMAALAFCVFLMLSVAQAEIRDCGGQTSHSHTPNVAIVTPVNFNSMPNGSLVSQLNRQYSFLHCKVNPGDRVRLKLVDVPGAKVVSGVTLKGYTWGSSASTIYTTSELEVRGLGFIITGASFWANVRCYHLINGVEVGDSSHEMPVVSSENVAPISQPDILGRVPSQCGGEYYIANGALIGIHMIVNLAFVKIRNSSLHASLPQNLNLLLFSVRVSGHRTFPVARLGISWSVTDFSSRVIRRTCTTLRASRSLIDFGDFNIGDWQVPVGTRKAQRNFTLTFNCPGAGYENISFFVEPKYGTAAGTYGNDGSMKIAQGAGMAKGVGVRLEIGDEWEGSFYWEPVRYRTESTSVNQQEGKYYLSNFYSSVDDPRTAPFKQEQIKFRASLIRLPEPLVAGQIKAAALIHIRYN